ncbi:MAG TPA: NUDIX hydrolase [Candidatus Saccharimonadales bacterium]|jgi:NAD+ diphosphatase|nr:NUDIX hydrolase [Candidatus Saccharimonadales bacterium]
MHTGPFSRRARPLTGPMRAEMDRLAGRLGTPIARDVLLDDIAFDPVGNPSRFAEVCMVVRRPSGNVLLSIKTFYPRGAYRLPTGGIDKDEPILDAVLRETREETGLTVEVRRFLAALTYRDGTDGPPVFHTFAFLLDDRSGAPVTPLDEHEQIESYREVPVSDLPSVAERLDRIPPDGARGIPNWDAWGRFRAHVHRAVHEALTAR